MSMTVVVTRNASDRYRGFLASMMLEIAPGTYVSPRMNPGVRERMVGVCQNWSGTLPADGSITVLWRDTGAPGGLGLAFIGQPKADLVTHEGLWLARKELTAADRRLLSRSDAR
jgi:CRISPR-associated protein Cas2